MSTVDAPSPEPGPAGRRPRVAVVFGGRSSEHAVSCATAAGVLRGDRPRRVRRACPIGITRDGRWVLVADEPAPLRARRPGHAARGRRRAAPRVVVPLATARPGADGPRAGPAAARARRGRRRLPAAARPVRRGRHAAGPARAGRTSATSAPACSPRAVGMDKHYMKLVFAGHGLPVGPYVVITDRAVAARPGRPRWTRSPALRLPGLRQAGPGRVEHGHHQGRRARPTSTAAIEAAREHDPKVVVEAAIAAARSSAGCWRATTAAPRATSVLGEIAVARRPRVLRLRGEVPRRGRRRARRARPTCPTEVADEVRELAAARLRGARLRGAGPGRLLRTPRRRGGRQRDQHDAGLHAALDVPADVGGDRPGLPRRWSTSSIQLALTPPHRPALSRAASTGQPQQRRSPWGTAAPAPA